MTLTAWTECTDGLGGVLGWPLGSLVALSRSFDALGLWFLCLQNEDQRAYTSQVLAEPRDLAQKDHGGGNQGNNLSPYQGHCVMDAGASGGNEGAGRGLGDSVWPGRMALLGEASV